MKLNKYSAAKNNTTVIGSYAAKNNSSSSSSSSSSSKASLDRNIWGQEDDGGDVDGDLTCQGNMYVVDNYIDNEDDDDTEDYNSKLVTEVPVPLAEGEDLSSKFDNDEGGNHYVKRQLVVDGRGDFKAIQYQSGYNLPDDDDSRKLASTEWVNRKIKAHKKLTIKDSKGGNLGEFDNSEDKTITINNYSNVSELNNDAGYITADDIPDIPEIDKNAPVILFSGSIHANNNDGSLTYQPWVVRPNLYSKHTSVEEIQLDYQIVNGEKKPSLQIKVIAKEGWTVKPTSVQSSVTLNEHWNPTVDFGGNRRSQGYWTTGGVFVDGNIYINVWRTRDENNDSVNNDCVAYNVQEMNITIFGLGYKN